MKYITWFKVKRYGEAFPGKQQSPAPPFSTPVKEEILISCNYLSIYLNVLCNMHILLSPFST